MNTTIFNSGKIFLISALVMLLVGLMLGVLAAHSYIIPDFWKNNLTFNQLRPMHVSSIMLWILLGCTGCIYACLNLLSKNKISNFTTILQYFLWVIAAIGIFSSYFFNDFGGREYWEFNPVFALPIILAWLILLFNFYKTVKDLKKWPVYIWMWMTGIVFFILTFTESYLWVFPYFREHFITDMTIQWKANGSIVGSWNQILYGTSFFLMDRISNNKAVGLSKMAFAMYFLGLFNLMFNWGHHVYTLPTDGYVRHVGYMVSMTEWVFFIKIIYTWKQSLKTMKTTFSKFPYRFIVASEIWVFINMGQAILMSIPALNLYTHGTHVTVAHAMGTTIGINTMILLAGCFTFLDIKCTSTIKTIKYLNISFWLTQVSLLIFWLTLNIIGIKKGLWQMQNHQETFGNMMDSLHNWFMLFAYSGSLLMLGIGTLATLLLKNYFLCKIKEIKSNKQLIKEFKNLIFST